MSRSLRTELELAWRALEESFDVELIGTFGDQLVCAPFDGEAGAWLDANEPDFDQFPVRREEETVGILLRGNHGSKKVRDVMLPLAENLVVSADMPITRLIPKLELSPYRLVLVEDRIDGLVTQSDLLKLPVRLVLFGLITHLEQAMADVVEDRFPDDSWLSSLSRGRKDNVLSKEREFADKKMNPPLLELTEFCDKQKLCSALVGGSKTKFNADMKGIQDLRDQLAHAATYLDPKEERANVANLVLQFENARHWLTELTSLLHDAD